MRLKTFIEMGMKKLEGQKALADHLNLSNGHVSEARAGRGKLPIAACHKLAELIEENNKKVVMASELRRGEAK